MRMLLVPLHGHGNEEGGLGAPSPLPLAAKLYLPVECPFFAAPFFHHSSRVGVGVAPGR